MSEQTLALHWLVVGYVSPGAEKWIKDAGGQVLSVNSEIPLIAVGLAYDPNGAWTWSHGRREHRQGIEFWSSGELQEASTGITLRYGTRSDSYALAEYCSAKENYLLLPDEEIDPTTGNEKESGMYDVLIPEPVTTNSASSDFDLGDLDEHPF